jgi:hypothetical protein
MANLTLEMRLVRPLMEPRPEPGCHVVVFKETGGGKAFDRVLPPGQTFRKRLMELFSSYTAYAVPADPRLRYRFSEQYDTGVGDLHDQFVLHVSLSYRVIHPEAIAERVDRDPLGRLQSEVKDVLLRQASMLRFEDLMNGHFDLEGYVLQVREHPPRAAEPSNLERFQELARDLGIELQRVEITRTYSSHKIGTGTERVKVDRESVLNKEKTTAEIELETLRRRGERPIEVLDSVTEGLRRIIENVSGDVGTVRELRGVVGEVADVRDEFARVLGGASVALPEPQVRGALGPMTEAGGAGVAKLWRSELQQLFEAVDTLDCRPSQKRVLVGKILHVLAEASLGRDSDDGSLEEHRRDLAEYCEAIDLVRAVKSPEHHRYLSRFRDAESLRQIFSEGEAHDEPAGVIGSTIGEAS